MAGDDRDSDLSDLAHRIDVARRRDDPAKSEAQGSADGAKLNFGNGLTIGVELVAGVGFGAVLGYVLDQWLETKPFMTILFFMLGTAAGMLNAWRHLVRVGMAGPKVDEGGQQGSGPADHGQG